MEEYERIRIRNKCVSISDELMTLTTDALHNVKCPRVEAAAHLEKNPRPGLLCECLAHQAFRRTGGEEAECLGTMISIAEPLNDHWGVELATSLLPLTLNRGSLVMTVKPSCGGSPYFVNFILKTPFWE